MWARYSPVLIVDLGGWREEGEATLLHAGVGFGRIVLLGGWRRADEATLLDGGVSLGRIVVLGGWR
ncbi:hypothetical protein ACLESO_55130, partial [Pyxidicoccus sp. 3LG]